MKYKLHSDVFPHYIKYMGSKTKILPFVIQGIESVYRGGKICDLFAGSCSLSGALGNQLPIISNDIQYYSSVIAKAYLTDWNNQDVLLEDILLKAKEYHHRYYKTLVLDYLYASDMTLEDFNNVEIRSQQLINSQFNNDWHLFTKYYSGTWWSVEQCTWIDSLRMAIEYYRNSSVYNTLLSCLMYAAAYNSQGTGHYAQYRDAKTESAMADIKIYRSKSILEYFVRKVEDVLGKLRTEPNHFSHKIIAEDYISCLNNLEKNMTVYADPPYCFVHYSRLYHILETMVLYDYPEIQTKNGMYVKGRYRVDRHQSPFCIRTQVQKAFDDMFSVVKQKNNSLVLSYSDTGMISVYDLEQAALKYFSKSQIELWAMDYSHMTMGRKNDWKRDVQEMLLLIKNNK